MGYSGYATSEGTARYRGRFAGETAAEHYSRTIGLELSSIGLGTYLGEFDSRTDLAYRDAVIRAAELGCNVFDTAINYRFQRSERSIGQALAALFERGKLQRDEVAVATKAGFLTFDGEVPPDPARYFTETYIDTGIIKPGEIVAGSHCMSPRYIQDQLERSRRNLGLECIDIFYLHNPETQLDEVPRREFYSRLLAAFEVLEKAADDGKIRVYGTATWNGYRVAPSAREHLPLAEIVKLAQEVGGENHRFKVIQLPYNLAMPEAFTARYQQVDGDYLTPLEAARKLGIGVFASASILQTRLARNLPPVIGEHLKGLRTDAQRAIQFVRSTPGIDVALVGMSSVAHVEENLGVARIPRAPRDELMKLFR